jgi:hypothetical protein
VLAAGGLQALRSALADTSAPSQIRLDAAWALANVAAGAQTQALRLLEDADTWEVLCATLEHANESAVSQECAWAVANVAKRGPFILARLDARKTLRLITFALKDGAAPTALAHALLDASEAILRHGDEQQVSRGLAANPLAAAASELGLEEVLEELQDAEHEALFRRAKQLLTAWFGATQEQKGGKENAPPSIEKGESTTPVKLTNKTPTKPSPASNISNRSPIPGVSPIRPFAHKSGGA